MRKNLTLFVFVIFFLTMLVSGLFASPIEHSAITATPTPQRPVHIDVDGHDVYLDCQGQGSPTIIMESGLGVSSYTWFKTQRMVREFTKVCSYDRAGLGQSERGKMPRTSAQIVEELHTLITNAEIETPFVLVGASFGGMTSLLYVSEYPDDVAALVLVDATHPDLDLRLEALLTPEQAQERRDMLADNAEGITFEDILTSDDQVRAAEVPDVPMIVLRHGIPFDVSEDWPGEALEALWIELTEDLANRSSNNTIIVAEKSGHRIAESEPELVSDAILAVIEIIQSEAAPEPKSTKEG